MTLLGEAFNLVLAMWCKDSVGRFNLVRTLIFTTLYLWNPIFMSYLLLHISTGSQQPISLTYCSQSIVIGEANPHIYIASQFTIPWLQTSDCHWICLFASSLQRPATLSPTLTRSTSHQSDPPIAFRTTTTDVSIMLSCHYEIAAALSCGKRLKKFKEDELWEP